MDRIIPTEKISHLRFGQLLINALEASGHLKQTTINHPITVRGTQTMDRLETQTLIDSRIAYEVVGVDLFYLENDELENILQKFIAGGYNDKHEQFTQ